MFITIGLAIAKALGKRVPDEGARLIGIGAFALLIVALAVPIKLAYDENVIAKHDRVQQAEIERDMLGAERSANASQAARDDQFATSQADISKGIDDARASDPSHGGRPVGPLSQSYFDRLRAQQQRGTAGKH